MSQNNLVLADGTGAQVLAAMNNALNTLQSNFSGPVLPTANLQAGQIALDTSNKVYWMRDSLNAKWMLHASDDAAMVVAKAAAYTAALSDFEHTLICTGTWTLGFAAAATLTDGWYCNVRNDGAGVITLDPNAAELIDGAATLALQPGQSCIVTCDGAVLHTIGYSEATAASDPTGVDSSNKRASTGWIRNSMSAIAIAAGFVASFVTNSYVKFPSWLGSWIIQFGAVAQSTLPTGLIVVPVTYPIAFPTGAYITLPAAVGGGFSFYAAAQAGTAAGFSINITNNAGASTSIGAFWLAIGK